jgi:hypothetical protein
MAAPAAVRAVSMGPAAPAESEGSMTERDLPITPKIHLATPRDLRVELRDLRRQLAAETVARRAAEGDARAARQLVASLLKSTAFSRRP